MKKTKLFGYLLALSIAVASCAGEDGDPGPQGETGETGATGAQGAVGDGFEKVGYFQGTVSGKRTDGTPFSEPFKYEYGSRLLSFRDNYIYISRTNKSSFSESDSYLEVNSLQLSGNTLVADPNATGLYFNFSKELNATDLFVVNARPYFRDMESHVMQISPSQNETYGFETNSNGTLNYYGPVNYGGTPAYVVYTHTGNMSFASYYRETGGTLLEMYSYSDGNSITSGTLFDRYNQLIFKYNADVDQPTFFDKATNEPLHAVIPDVPADQFTVTNYVHDASTGYMTFDFVLKISQYRPRTGYGYGYNSSGNDLTITGSFSSGKKVYSNVVSRTASGE